MQNTKAALARLAILAGGTALSAGANDDQRKTAQWMTRLARAGAEPKTVLPPDGKPGRRCLVWTDTSLRRKGRWQVIAVQDNRVDRAAK